MTLHHVPGVPGVFPTAKEAEEHARVLLKGKAPAKAEKPTEGTREQLEPRTDETPTKEVS